MKKKLCLLLSICLMVTATLTGCLVPAPKKNSVIGETYQSSDFEFTVNAVEMSEYLNNTTTSDDFLKPVDEDYVNTLNNQYTKAYKEEHVLVYISFNVKNISKSDQTFDDIGVIDFDNGYKYDNCSIYCKNENGVWTSFSLVKLPQLIDEAYEIRGCIQVPKEVMTSDKSLTYTLFGREFTLR